MSGKVIIAGCGISGATLAIGLLQRGFEVRIFEQSGVVQELGAGLTVPASAMRGFDALGLWPRMREISVRQAGMTYVHYQTGEILTGQPDEVWDAMPERVDQSVHTHRALLHKLLVDAIRELDPGALHAGRRLRGFDQDETGVTAHFESGESVRGDVLIGADGLRSAVRAQLFEAATPRFTGVVAIRALVPADDIREFLGGGRASNFVGPMRGFLRYGVRRGTLINCVALAKDDRWPEEGWDNRSSRAELLDLYGDWHPNVVGIINGAPPDAFYKWALYDREPLPRWSVGRVTLLGDAAHPMLPYLGQGATMAVEDGVVLARALDAYDDPAVAVAAYESARLERTSAMVAASRGQSCALNHVDPYTYARRKVEVGPMGAYDPGATPV